MTVRRRRSRIHGARWLDVPYASGHALRKLDVWLPTSATPPFPFVFYIHGGGWQTGTKTFGAGEAPLACLANGWAVVSVDYRLTDSAAWPGQSHDCKAALRFVKANAARFALDPTRICAWGSSAGAYLASVLAFTAGVASLRDASLGHGSVDEGVQGLISWFAPIDFPTEDADFTTQVLEGGPAMNRGAVTAVCSLASQEAELMGGAATPVQPCTASQAAKDAVSVLYWVRNRTRLPRAIRIEHGIHNAGVGGDNTIPIGQARRFRDELQLAGLAFAPNTARHYAERSGARHGIGSAAWTDLTFVGEVMTWLQTHV